MLSSPRFECSMYLCLPQWGAWFIPMLTLNLSLDATGRVSRSCSCPAIDHRHQSILASPIIIESQKEGQALQNWCFWTLMLEKTLESPLDCKEIQPVHPKENQSWIFIGRTHAEVPVLWPPNAKSWLIRKDPDAGKDWRRKGGQHLKDEMVGWYHLLESWWTWVSANFGRWWRTGKPGLL